jgi:hypothetical protein
VQNAAGAKKNTQAGASSYQGPDLRDTCGAQTKQRAYTLFTMPSRFPLRRSATVKIALRFRYD